MSGYCPGEIVLPRRVRPQPTPDLNKGGDCGACVLGGLLDITITEAYQIKDQKPSSFTWSSMQRALRVLAHEGRIDRCITTPARFEVSDWRNCWPGDVREIWPAWADYVMAMVTSGMYGIAEVDHQRLGGPLGGPDHWVMICGARAGWGGADGRSWTAEVLVSCSARSSRGLDEWVPVEKFLRERGGYNLFFARPKT